MKSFLRNNAIGLLALFVALSGTAYAFQTGGISSTKVHFRYGAHEARCQPGETVVGGGGDIAHGYTAAGDGFKMSEPFKDQYGGNQGWKLQSTKYSGYVRAVAICVQP